MAGCSSSTPGQGSAFCPDVAAPPAIATPSPATLASRSPHHLFVIGEILRRVRLKADTTDGSAKAGHYRKDGLSAPSRSAQDEMASVSSYSALERTASRTREAASP